MHGTLLNNVQLPRREMRAISDGDVVVFGAEVRRGPETFPACAFRINFEFLPCKTANTFAFPESSDVEDEEDYEYSDEEMDYNKQGSSDDGVSIESPPLKMSQAIESIDLTEDDTPIDFTSNRIDLTGETPAEKRLMDLMAGRPADISEDADPVSIAVYAGNAPHLQGSECGDADDHFSSDAEEHSDEVASDNSNSSDEYDMDEPEDSDNEDAIGDYDVEELQESPDVETQEVSAMNNLARYAVATNENQTVLLSDMQPQSDERSVDCYDDEGDDDSDFGLSGAGEEGIRTMFAEGLLNDRSDLSYPGAVESLRREAESIAQITETAKHVTFAPTEDTSESLSLFATPNEPASLPVESTKPTNSILAARQPSPSDAAMVKAPVKLGQSSSNTANPIDIYHMASAQFRQHTAEALGEKAGKSDFFKARQDNKVNVQAAENKPENFSHTFSTTTTPFAPKAQATGQDSRTMAPNQGRILSSCIGRRGRFAPADYLEFSETSTFRNSSASRASYNAQIDYSMFTEPIVGTAFLTEPTAPPALVSFLDKPDEAPIQERAPSPEPDMTSAVKYNESKATIAAAVEKTMGPQPVRSGLRIDDIIESDSAKLAEKTLKRKADVISNVVEEEVRIWGSAPTPSIASGSRNEIESESQPAAKSEATGCTDTVPNGSEPRPAKRLKKFMENVAFAAVGGVAVGAVLFGALVATAPEFM